VADETRVLSFSNAEVIEAIVDYCEKTNRTLPPGGIKGLNFSNDKEIKVTVQSEGQATLGFYENEIVAALILLCNKKGIPVARRALKSLQVAQGIVSLHLVIRALAN
jgi:hypothetical protein